MTSCPTCNSPVIIQGGKEGTRFYLPDPSAEIRGMELAIEAIEAQACIGWEDDAKADVRIIRRAIEKRRQG